MQAMANQIAGTLQSPMPIGPFPGWFYAENA